MTNLDIEKFVDGLLDSIEHYVFDEIYFSARNLRNQDSIYRRPNPLHNEVYKEDCPEYSSIRKDLLPGKLYFSRRGYNPDGLSPKEAFGLIYYSLEPYGISEDVNKQQFRLKDINLYFCGYEPVINGGIHCDNFLSQQQKRELFNFIQNKAPISISDGYSPYGIKLNSSLIKRTESELESYIAEKQDKDLRHEYILGSLKYDIEYSNNLPKEISNIFYAYLNCPAYEAAEQYPLTKEGKNGIEYQIARLEARLEDEEFKEHTRFGDPYSENALEDEAIEEEIQRLENYQETTFNIIDKYCSLSEDERKDLNLDPKLSHQLDCLLMIQNDVHCLAALRLREQELLIYDKQADYSCNLDNCQAVYPGTQDKLFSHSPYIVTDVKFSTPPYADGKPLTECPGWQGLKASYGHIDSITIENGNGKTVTFSGEQIDKDNNLVFELKDMTVKYGIETGEARFFPHQKQTITIHR